MKDKSGLNSALNSAQSSSQSLNLASNLSESEKRLKQRLDLLAAEKNTNAGLFMADDPLQVAKLQSDEFAILLCALFAYGNAKQILKLLKSFDFSLLNLDESVIKKELKGFKYRFQNENDIMQIFITLRRFKQDISLKEFFYKSYKRENAVWQCFKDFIAQIYTINSYSTQGYNFFFGSKFDTPKTTFKRYNLFLRWLVRKDALDMGLWSDKFNPAHLLIPLDTHTHKVALKNKLLLRKCYDFKAVYELSLNLAKFDPADPIKYDFALYRLGQSKELEI